MNGKIQEKEILQVVQTQEILKSDSLAHQHSN